MFVEDHNKEKWKNELSNYGKEKKNVQYEYPQVDRIIRKSGLRQRRTRNPVTHSFYNPSQEEAFKEKQEKFIKRHLERGKERQKQSEGNFNIITGRGDAEGKVYQPFRPSIKRKQANDQCETDFDSLFLKGKKQDRRREYDIISNDYREENEEKKSHDNEQFQTNVMNKFDQYKQNDLRDPVTHTGRKDSQLSPKGVKKTMHQPIMNIVTNEVIDEKRVKRLNSSDLKRLRRCEKGKKLQNQFSNRRDQELERKEKRLLNRNKRGIRHNMNYAERGYNILSNIPYEGVDSRKPIWMNK